MASQPSDKKAKEDLKHLIASYAGDENTGTLRNGFAMHLCNKYKFTDASFSLDSIFMQRDSSYASNRNAVYKRLIYITGKMSPWKKNLSRYWHLIEKFLMEPITAPVPRSKNLPSTNKVNTPVDMLEGTAQESPPPAKKLRLDCEQCVSVREECRFKCQALECNLREKRVMIRTISKTYKVKYVNRQRKRFFERIAKLKNKNMSLKQLNSDLKKNLASLETGKGIRKIVDLTLTISKLTSEVQTLKEKLQSSDEEKKEATTD